MFNIENFLLLIFYSLLALSFTCEDEFYTIMQEENNPIILENTDDTNKSKCNKESLEQLYRDLYIYSKTDFLLILNTYKTGQVINLNKLEYEEFIKKLKFPEEYLTNLEEDCLSCGKQYGIHSTKDILQCAINELRGENPKGWEHSSYPKGSMYFLKEPVIKKDSCNHLLRLKFPYGETKPYACCLNCNFKKELKNWNN